MNAAVILITIILLSVAAWIYMDNQRAVNICVQHNYTDLDTERLLDGVYMCYRTVAVNGIIVKEYGVVHVQ